MPRVPSEVFVGKRAENFVLSYFSSRDVSIHNSEHQDLGVDYLIDIRKDHRELARYLALQVKGYLDLPSNSALEKDVARLWPRRRLEDFMLPLLLCVVEVKTPHGFYGWLLEPRVEDDRPILRTPREYAWGELNASSVNKIYEQTQHFWEAMLRTFKR